MSVDVAAHFGAVVRAVEDRVHEGQKVSIYAVDAAPIYEIDEWLEQFRALWPRKLDALATEVARGKKGRNK